MRCLIVHSLVFLATGLSSCIGVARPPGEFAGEISDSPAIAGKVGAILNDDSSIKSWPTTELQAKFTQCSNGKCKLTGSQKSYAQPDMRVHSAQPSLGALVATNANGRQIVAALPESRSSGNPLAAHNYMVGAHRQDSDCSSGSCQAESPNGTAQRRLCSRIFRRL
jgi:hypothetical protein